MGIVPKINSATTNKHEVSVRRDIALPLRSYAETCRPQRRTHPARMLNKSRTSRYQSKR
jgi:hypothetical protein